MNTYKVVMYMRRSHRFCAHSFLYTPLMKAQDRTESTREPIKFYDSSDRKLTKGTLESFGMWIFCTTIIENRGWKEFKQFILKSDSIFQTIYCPVGLGCRIHILYLFSGVLRPPIDCPGYETKQSNVKVPVMQELGGMRSPPLLPLIPGPL